MKKLFSDNLLLSNFIGNLFYSIAYPSMHYVLIKDVGERMISFSSIIICFTGFILPMMWNKYSDKLYNKLRAFLLLEVITYISIIGMLVMGIINSKFYYIADTLLFALITRNIICAENKLTSIRYTGDEREKFDNNSILLSNSSSVIGFTISFIITIPTNLAFILMGIGIILDKVFYYRAYKESKITEINEDCA